MNDRGGSGTAAGTTSWSIPDVPLAAGVNVITVTARDVVGNTTTDTLTVTVATLVYYLAEGATGAFFDYDLLLANPNAVAAPVSTTFLRDDGTTVVDARVLRADVADDDPRRRHCRAWRSTAVSAVVTSTNAVPIVVERSMYWDGTYYGGHAGSSVAAPATTWLFGEGLAGLLRHLRAARQRQRGARQRHGDVPARGRARRWSRTTRSAPTSRFNVFAGRDSGARRQVVLDRRRRRTSRSSPSARCTSGRRCFNGGHESAGVTAASTTWFHAEGATGPFFDTYILVGNPNAAPATVTFTFLLDERGGRSRKVKTIAGQHAADGQRRGRGSAAGQHGGVDDGDVGPAGDLGAGDVLAGRVHDLVRGAQQLRRDADGDEVGAGGGAVGRAVQLPDLHPAGQPEPDDGGDRADHVPEDRRDDAW